MSTDNVTPISNVPAVSPIREQAVIERGRAMDSTSFDSHTTAFSNGNAFNLACKMAEMMASASILPDAYRGQPANCLVVIEYASRMGMSPMMLAQNMDVVKGRPALRGTFLAARINACGLFSRLRYEWCGTPGADDYGCRAVATDRETGDVLEGMWITWAMVKAEGWHTNAKWTNLREQMFMYRATAFWGRVYASDVILGLHETEELRDIEQDYHGMRQLPAGAARGDLDTITASLRDRAQLVTETSKQVVIEHEAQHAAIQRELAEQAERERIEAETAAAEKAAQQAAAAAEKAARKRPAKAVPVEPATGDKPADDAAEAALPVEEALFPGVFPPAAPTAAELRAKLVAATSLDELDDAFAAIEKLPKDEQKALRLLYVELGTAMASQA